MDSSPTGWDSLLENYACARGRKCYAFPSHPFQRPLMSYLQPTFLHFIVFKVLCTGHDTSWAHSHLLQLFLRSLSGVPFIHKVLLIW